MQIKQALVALTIFGSLAASLFAPALNIRQLKRELAQDRKLNASELLNWVHAVHYVHTASESEKKSTLDQLKSQVTEAQNQNSQIGDIIKKT